VVDSYSEYERVPKCNQTATMMFAMMQLGTARIARLGAAQLPRMAIFSMSASNDAEDGAACVKLDSVEVPEFANAEDGDFYACSEPPADDANLTCYQVDDAGGWEDGEGQAAHPGLDGKSWICIDRTSLSKNDEEGEDGY